MTNKRSSSSLLISSPQLSSGIAPWGELVVMAVRLSLVPSGCNSALAFVDDQMKKVL